MIKIINNPSMQLPPAATHVGSSSSLLLLPQSPSPREYIPGQIHLRGKTKYIMLRVRRTTTSAVVTSTPAQQAEPCFWPGRVYAISYPAPSYISLGDGKPSRAASALSFHHNGYSTNATELRVKSRAALTPGEKIPPPLPSLSDATAFASKSLDNTKEPLSPANDGQEIIRP